MVMEGNETYKLADCRDSWGCEVEQWISRDISATISVMFEYLVLIKLGNLFQRETFASVPSPKTIDSKLDS